VKHFCENPNAEGLFSTTSQRMTAIACTGSTQEGPLKKVDVRALVVESQNPHLPAAAPAGLLSRKVTGEVTFAALRISQKNF
jgi:hypothetical protein